jgi:hypothetical protein
MPYVNWAKRIINKGIYALVGKTPRFNLSESHEFLLPLYQEILYASGKDFYWNGVQMGKVTGDIFLKIVYDENRELVKDRVYIEVLDSEKCFPKYVRGKIVKFRHYFNDIGIGKDGEEAIIGFYEEWDNLQWKICTISDDVVAVDENGNKMIFENTLGYVPFVHGVNLRSGKNLYGVSDIRDMIELNKIYNTALVRYMDATEYDGNPLLACFGFNVTEIEREVDRTWGDIPIDGKIETIGGKSDYPAIQKLLELSSAALQVSEGIPKGSLGDESPSYATGTGLQVHYLPLEEKIAPQKLTYGETFSSAFSYAMRLKNRVEGLGLEERQFSFKRMKKLDVEEVLNQDIETPIEVEEVVSNLPYYHVEIYFQDYLPKNRAEELVSISQEMKLRLESQRGALRRLGVENIEEKITELEETRQKDIDAFIREANQEASGLDQAALELAGYQKPISPGDVSTGAKTQRQQQEGEDVKMSKRRVGSKRSTPTGYKNDKGQKTL